MTTAPLTYNLLTEDGSVLSETFDSALCAELPSLPEDPWAYFEKPAGTRMVPTDRLINSRARPKGIRNANRLMQAAARGETARRAPISVAARPDGYWLVLDGNSTTLNALLSGWRAIPAIVQP